MQKTRKKSVMLQCSSFVVKDKAVICHVEKYRVSVVLLIDLSHSGVYFRKLRTAEVELKLAIV